MSAVRIVSGVGELAENYDGYILDLWGVVHDGVRPFPGVLDAMDRLRSAGKRIVLLSNAPRRVAAVEAQLERLGVPRDAYDGLMSSGEETWRHLAERPDPWYRALGRRCLHIGPERDRGMLEGLDLVPVATAEEAEFVLATGTFRDGDPVEAYEALLTAAVSRHLPMVCANPDRIVVRGGRAEICAGTIAERYETLGGEVRWHGKPDPSVYRLCLNMLGVGDRRRVLCAGDSFRTDIRGANAAGVDSLLVACGIHEDELCREGSVDPAAVARSARAAGAVVTYVARSFAW